MLIATFTTIVATKGEADLQTKSLDCRMTTYTVETNGELRDSSDEKVDFTGMVRFYGGAFEDDKPWVEFIAKFIKGRLVSVWEYDNPTNSVQLYPTFPPEAGDVIDWVLYRWECYTTARTPFEANRALVALADAMGDLATFHPDYDLDSGEIQREEA